MPNPRSRSVRQKDLVCFVGVVLLWLLPLLSRGLTDRPLPGMPRFLKYLHNASCLFTQSVTHWRLDYIQVRLTPDSHWITVPESSYFRMQPFGYDRTRFHRFMDLSLDPSAETRRGELARWIRQRYTELNPDQPVPIAVRFVCARYLPPQIPPSGRWQKPPLESFRPNEIFVLSTHTVDGTQVDAAPDHVQGDRS